MTNFIPIFPLGIVVYPGEQLNLHIFEPRYKQLISECFAEKKPFGIPVVLNDQVTEIGTLVEVTEITQVFRILEVIRSLPEKLYSGAIVNYPHNNNSGSKAKMQKVVQGIRQMHDLLSVKKDFKKQDKELCSYDVAHHAGLSLQEENELLALMHELQRQEYLVRHLAKILPLITGMELLKEKINLNGHFKNLGGFDIS
jgi:Lon protease-like protein